MNRHNDDKSTKKKKLTLPIAVMVIACGGVVYAIIRGINSCTKEGHRIAQFYFIIYVLVFLVGTILAARNMLKSNLKHSSVLLKLALITFIALHVGLLVNFVAPNAYNMLFYYDDVCVGSIDFGTFATWILNMRLV